MRCEVYLDRLSTERKQNKKRGRLVGSKPTFLKKMAMLWKN